MEGNGQRQLQVFLRQPLNTVGQAAGGEADVPHPDVHALGVLRHAHERQRQADLVVEIALGLFRAELLREHGVKQLLGRGLADRTGHADDRAAAHHAVAARQIEQRLRGVPDVERRDRILLARPMAHDRRRAVFERLSDEIMAVEALARERQEQCLLRNATRVGRDCGEHSVSRRLALRPLRRLRQCKSFHAVSPSVNIKIPPLLAAI